MIFRDRMDMLPQGTRVLVGMSGGVDSSVAAALLVERGFDVIGISLHLWDYPSEQQAPSRCCAPEDLDDARRSAEAVGIPYFTLDRRSAFTEHVVSPFIDAYLEGVTPSPCVSCNREVKIGAFVALCKRFGASAFSTGHYARSGVAINSQGQEQPTLLRAVDTHKDQSYFLYGIGSQALSMLLTPLGYMTKNEVRTKAVEFGLSNAKKPDSEDLCFTAHNHIEFVESRARDRIRPGPIFNSTGQLVGHHEGVHRFTIGQRKGLGVALGKPVFVSAIDAETASVHLGDLSDIQSHEAIVTNCEWFDKAFISNDACHVTARIRYRHEGARAKLERIDHDTRTLRVSFESATRAITPGQICVFYDGDRVLGGGTIVQTPKC